MTTARDQLCSEAFQLLKNACHPQASAVVGNLLDQFRIQAKPNTQLQKGATAREMLGESLLVMWQKAGKKTDQEIKNLVDQYRMQAKQTKTEKVAHSSADEKETPKRSSRKASSKKNAPPLFVSRIHSEPVAGGPQKRHGARGECPKCHSKGVVLARSYAGDEYFSCIYCGFQAYTKNFDQELDLPLALELLGRRFDDKDTVEEQPEQPEEEKLGEL